MTTYFADVIVPLPLPKLFTYRIPLGMEHEARPLMRVVVPFGRKKLYAGLIAKVHSTPPAAYQAKYIEQVLDETPIINEVNFKLWKWISEYYMCPMG
ncbi:primosomal protein N', partial [Salibacteraceae bacterium]|nr:primosomal protein N' [Salibacteraceae bacterium]